MPALSDLESVAHEAERTAAAVLQLRPVRSTVRVVKTSELALYLEAFVAGLAMADTLVMLRLDSSDLPEHHESALAYLAGAWGLDAAALDDLAERLALSPTTTTHGEALALRDELGAASGRVAEAARTIGALAAGSPEVDRLAAAAARLERYRAREVSRAELDRVLDLAGGLLAGRAPPRRADPPFRLERLRESRHLLDDFDRRATREDTPC